MRPILDSWARVATRRRIARVFVATLAILVLRGSPLDAQSLAGGVQHSLWLKADGTVWAVGENGDRQLGDNSTTDRRTSIVVPGLSNVVAIAAGRAHSMALDNVGVLRVWGDNVSGQVGDNSTTDRGVPVTVALTGVAAIAAGEYHSIARLSNGDVYAWGRNTNGQLGTGNTTNPLTPVLVSTGAIAVGAGASHSLIVKSDGTVWAAGLNGNGQLGDGSTTQRTSFVQMTGVAGASNATGGSRHSLILLANGGMVAAGLNSSGQLGDNSTTQRPTAVGVSSLSGVTAIAAGYDHSAARTSDGLVWSWGNNGSGQIGDGSTTNVRVPTEIVSVADATAVTAGHYHTAAVDASGIVWTWGRNDGGQLGDGTLASRLTPDTISGAGFDWRVATPVFNVATGTYTSDRVVTVTTDTAGATIHYTQNGSQPTESDPVVASGGTVTVSTSQTVKAAAWKAGMPASAVMSATYELKVATPTTSPGAGTYTTAQSVSMSTTTPGVTLRYTTDTTDPTASSPEYTAQVPVATTTTVKTAGYKTGWTRSDTRTATFTMNFGVLSAPTPSPAAGSYDGQVVVTLSATNGASIRYTTNGAEPSASSTLYTGSLTLGVTTTLKAKAFHPDYTTSATTTQLYTITALAPVLSRPSGTYDPGDTFTITSPDPAATLRITLNGATPSSTDRVVVSGTIMAVGRFTIRARAFKTGALDSAVAEATYDLTADIGPGVISAGSSHTVLATPDGLVYAWGLNSSNQLGDGATTTRTQPELLTTLTGVTSLAASTAHTLAATRDGRLYAWGNNGSGRLGDGTTTTRPLPTLITTLSNVTAVAVGDTHSLALLSDGTVYAWGVGSNGQLGQGTTSALSVPTQVPGLANIVAIAAGGTHSLAATATGDLYAWGANASGQLGDGTTTPRLSPVPISLAGVVELAAGTTHTVARLQDGSVYAWGAGSSGQLGQGTTSNRNAPGPITGLIASRVTAGGAQSGVIRGDGVLVTWGANGSGQLGDGTITNRTSPTAIAGPLLARLSAGGTHMAGVTTTGEVWTWGAGSNGQLGHGTTTARSVPEPISAANYEWRVATPAFSVAPGVYTTDRTVVVTVATPGSTIHYTQSGLDPTESDPVVASGGSVLVDRLQTLRATAWKAGVPASATASALYTMKVGQPTLSPAGGTYATPQNVTATTVTPGTTLRYTTDGTDPTEASSAYAGPIPVATKTTLKVTGFKTDWAASDVRNGSYVMNFGTLAAPVATPAGSSYVGDVSVTLAAMASATIRYTTNSAEPTASSTIYTGPLTIATTTTLKAKAYHDDYTASPTSTNVYTVTSPAPTLSLPTGTYAAGDAVTITHPDSAVTIRITLDGSDPTASATSVLSGTSLFVGGYTLKARAFKTGTTDSSVTHASYTLTETFGPGALASGTDFTLLSTPDGLLYTWGRNFSGQLGSGSTTNRSTPGVVHTLTGVTHLAAGNSHALAATVDGALYVWGSNGSGQLGDGTTSGRLRPTLVPALANVKRVAAGASHSLALTADGQVYTWGANDDGQLGLGSSGSVSAPTLITGLPTIVWIAAGDAHSLAVTGTGQVYVWGRNTNGQIGDGTISPRATPRLLASLPDIVAVTGGASHSLALARGGDVYAWGSGSSGQLGQGTTADSWAPVQVPGLTAVEIAARATGSRAVRADGALVAWGANTSGQIGDGTTTPRSVPTAVTVPATVGLMENGASHGTMITPAGAIWTWGSGASGQLGDGTTVSSRVTPQTVATIAGAWGPTTAPRVDLPGGIYDATQVVTVTAPMLDSVVRYTTNGVDPTVTDPTIPVGGQLPIDGTTPLRVRAWSPGRVPSLVVAPTYTLQPVTPAITPAPGTYTTAQTVTLSTPTSGTTLRYTLDGTEPGPTSTLYAAAFPLNTTTTVKARAFRPDWTPSVTARARIVLSFGTLTTPVATPAAGTYDPGQLVTLTAQVGAVIRYTIDGTTPTEVSPVYTQPIDIGMSGSRMISARAFALDYTPSPISTQTYIVNTTPPLGGTLTSIEVTPSTTALAVSATVPFVATGHYSGGQRRDITATATWTSADEAVAMVATAGLVSGAGRGETTVTATVGAESGDATVQVLRSRFAFTGPLQISRTGDMTLTGTLLADGRVLMTGGTDPNDGTSAEIYDPATGRFTRTGDLVKPRESHTATLLPDGRVLIVGGWSRVSPNVGYLNDAEIFDPQTNTFTATSPLITGRGGHTATLLDNGLVLIAGGVSTTFAFAAQAELFDPAAGRFIPTGSLVTLRADGTATRLDDGTVLLAGGSATNFDNLAAAETYDPATGTFTAAGNLGTATANHMAAKLANGLVLVAGGYLPTTSTYTTRAELYDPVARMFVSTGSMLTPHDRSSATTLPDGDVLIVGGGTGVAELYRAVTGRFEVVGAPNHSRVGHAAVRLLDGTVLIAGGTAMATPFLPRRTAELYQAGTTLPPATSLQMTPAGGTMRVGEKRQLLVTDSFGRPRADAVWMVDDPSLATLSLDDEPTLTAVAAGTVTVSATVGGVLATAPIVIVAEPTLAVGAPLWTTAAPGGFDVVQVVKSEPTWDTPALYVISSNETESQVQALGIDGRQMWQTLLPLLNGQAAPDAFGGLLVTMNNTCPNDGTGQPMSIANLDATTGQINWQQTSLSNCTFDAPQFSITPNGNVVVVSPGNTSGLPPLMKLNGETGAALSIGTSQPIPSSTFKDITGHVTSGYSRVGPPITTSYDDNSYMLYEQRNVDYPLRVTNTALWLLILNSSVPGRVQLTSSTDNVNLFPGRIVPDAADGVIATWQQTSADVPAPPLPLHPFRAARIVAGSVLVTYDLPLSPDELERDETGQPKSPMLVLGEAGNLFVSYGSELASINPATGSVYWTYSAAPKKIDIVAASDDQGVVAKTYLPDEAETIVRFTAGGSPSTDGWTARLVDHHFGHHWVGTAGGLFSVFNSTIINTATTGWSTPQQEGQNSQKRAIHVPNPTQDPPQQTKILEVLAAIRAGLVVDPPNPPPQVASCATWLVDNSGMTALRLIDHMVPAPPQPALVGHGDINKVNTTNHKVVDRLSTSAVHGIHNLGGYPSNIPSSWMITVNKKGAFFNRRGNSMDFIVGPQRYAGNTARAQAEILVHEIAHAVKPEAAFMSDFENEAAKLFNDLQIDLFCGDFIKRNFAAGPVVPLQR